MQNSMIANGNKSSPLSLIFLLTKSFLYINTIKNFSMYYMHKHPKNPINQSIGAPGANIIIESIKQNKKH